ncbi:MAG TPA: malto-oligosyltrehalose trehalohydrolase [Candidatus Eremiobacteraceae bacterium]|nr:malto-oligosyltrehalose trehalohydrolase [Candidatus Eremiobacteraceae bacterium]
MSNQFPDNLEANALSPGTAHVMPFGTQLLSAGGVRFSLWAPAQDRMRLVIQGIPEPVLMAKQSEGWHVLHVPQAKPGTRYQFLLQDGLKVPDPASRFQPDDVHGLSEVIDPHSYRWNSSRWTGRPWHESILYELHVGAFTPEGTFRSAIQKLDHLVNLGVTAIELMPLADFPGRFGWGYDGVLLFAPDSSYGRPDDLKALVDAAHDKGLMMFLDVVYNHFGPEGNYLPSYAPFIYTERHHTPWGKAINFYGPHSSTVRDLIIHNALYWLEEFRFDGLRLDAVHAITDDSPKHILQELAERVRASVGSERHVHLVLENYANQSRFLIRTLDHQPMWYSAQWNDDLHHALHVAATHEGAGYYTDYVGDLQKLGRGLAEGFAYQGEPSAFAGGKRGEPSAFLPPVSFVSFIQNHDQVGNRALGERLTMLAKTPAVRAVASVFLLAPQVPLLFMGEEWAATSPFPFFCDLSGDLRDAVREGRRKEFASFPEFRDAEKQAQIPDPVSASTLHSARLRWDEIQSPQHQDWLAWYQSLLALRHSEIVPRLPHFPAHSGTFLVRDSYLRVNWKLTDHSELQLQACLSDQPAATPFDFQGRLLWRQGNPTPEFTPPWSVLWSIRNP